MQQPRAVSILPLVDFTIQSDYTPAELGYRVAKVTKPDPDPAPHMPLKCYWGQHDQAAFHIAPLYRGPNRAEEVNDPALLYYHGQLQPAGAGTTIHVAVRWSNGLTLFAVTWYAICLATAAILIGALIQTIQLGQFSPSMVLLGILPVLMVLLLWLPLLAYIRHHADQQRQYLTALFQQATIPRYVL